MELARLPEGNAGQSVDLNTVPAGASWNHPGPWERKHIPKAEIGDPDINRHIETLNLRIRTQDVWGSEEAATLGLVLIALAISAI